MFILSQLFTFNIMNQSYGSLSKVPTESLSYHDDPLPSPSSRSGAEIEINKNNKQLIQTDVYHFPHYSSTFNDGHVGVILDNEEQICNSINERYYEAREKNVPV